MKYTFKIIDETLDDAQKIVDVTLEIDDLCQIAYIENIGEASVNLTGWKPVFKTNSTLGRVVRVTPKIITLDTSEKFHSSRIFISIDKITSIKFFAFEDGVLLPRIRLKINKGEV